jgi:ribulose-5-phosphate 4-epimerase/fuculose-1-phosphate aldolase
MPLVHERSFVPIRPTMSDQERRTRVDLAAMFRLAALNHWDDVIFTHISAVVPGEHTHFLINPSNLMFEEITASTLVKVDLDGTIIDTDGRQQINPAGFAIHSAIHAARPEAKFVVHLHTDDGIAVSCQTEGLLPLAQTSVGMIHHVAYHDYEGVAEGVEEGVRMVASLGDKMVLILRNHGTLSVGRTAGEAWMYMYWLERACTQQVRALSAGREGIMIAPQAAQERLAQQGKLRPNPPGYIDEAWNALLRKLRRVSPGYDR